MPAKKSVAIEECFSEVTDPRRREGTYPLINFLVIAICAVICGADDFVAIAEFGRAKKKFLERFLDAADRSHLFASACVVFPKVVEAAGSVGVRNSGFKARWRPRKPRSLPPLPQGDCDLAPLAHRQRSGRLKKVPARHFQQDRVENARAASHAEATQARHAF